ncbi:MAG: tetratricopeptide repeat protein [Actinomycetales bacterium]|nr:tetratricopeptide repeat protein [Actinomycetales bacterium]
MVEQAGVGGTAPLQEFAARLRECHVQAGEPSLRALEKATERLGHRFGRASIADKLNARSKPDWEFVETFVRACAVHTGATPTEATRLDLDDWREAHRQLLRDLAARRSGHRRATNASAALWCTLPPDVVGFTGRHDQVDAIVTTARKRGASEDGVVAIHAIDGMPGIGKTALAVHVAHRLRRRFPDGQWFVDLHAHTPGHRPTEPADALAGLLIGDGVDPRSLPDDLEGRSGMWRGRMATRRVLLVLDNAAGSDQVTPLLPGGPGCLALITSRRHLADLPAAVTSVSLDVLPPDQARQMFLGLAPHTAGDPAAVAELVEVCGHLPLAISLLGRLATKHPTWTVGDLITETRSRLLTVAAENRSVAAAFDLSYDHLPPERQRVFRLLGLHPGAEIDAYAAAALTDLPVTEAADHLDALYSDHLLRECGYRRYGMHDLVREYAHERAVTTEPADDRDHALNRLLDYYQHTAAIAAARVSIITRPTPTKLTKAQGLRDDNEGGGSSPELKDFSQALAWLRSERSNLLACLAHITAPRRVVTLTAGMAGLLRIDGPGDLAMRLHSSAADAATALADSLAHANALVDLSDVYFDVGDYAQAANVLQTALLRYEQLGNRLGQANALCSEAVTRLVTGDHTGAEAQFHEALLLYRALEDGLGEANALYSLGESQSLNGDCIDAARLLRSALELFRASGSPLGQVMVLNSLAATQRVSGDYPRARSTLQRALHLSRSIGDTRNEAIALNNLGILHYRTGDLVNAERLLLESLHLFRELGNQLGENHSLMDLGVVRRLAGDFTDSEATLRIALDLYRERGDQGGEIETLNELGILYRMRGELPLATSCHQKAMNLSQMVDLTWDKAHSLAGLGRCSLAVGNTEDAVIRLQEALALFQRMSLPETHELELEIAEIMRSPKRQDVKEGEHTERIIEHPQHDNPDESGR